MSSSRRSALFLSLAVLGAFGIALTAGEPSSGRLTYTKVFKGSLPEYTRVTVEENGEAAYQGGAADHPDAPEAFRLSPAVAARLFDLAAELGYFQGVELESGQRVAHMGQKTFLYQKGGLRGVVSYNHTRNETAQGLQLWFDRIARGRYLVSQLEHRLVFDRLGLLDTLREFEREFNAGELVDLEQFVSVLERVAGDPRSMHLVKTRAQALLRRIRGGAATLRFEYGDQDSGWYYKVVLVDQGGATYEARRFADPSNPQRLDLPEASARRLWELAQQANYFRDPLSAQGRSERLNGYRFTYEAGPEHREVAFSVPPTATLAEMVHLFQQALAQEHFRQRLTAAMQEKSYQLQVVLQELDVAVRDRKLIAPRDFLSVLEGIANGEAHHPIVRGLAQRLVTQIRDTNP